jgi:peptide deformylase
LIFGALSGIIAEAMSILRIREFPDDVLRRAAEPVQNVDGRLQSLIDDMFETLYAAPGLGLAAPQVGTSLRLFVYDLGNREGEHERKIILNPTIVAREGEIAEEEGCLSIPDYREIVKRAAKVFLKGYDQDGREVQLEAQGLEARLFQHELDHLDGVLMFDRMSPLKRDLFQRKLKKRLKTAGE